MTPFSRRNVLLALLAGAIVLPPFANFYHLFVANLVVIYVLLAIGLLLAAAIVAVGFLGSRLLGIVRTAVIARVFGSGIQLDAYNVAFNVPDLIFQVLAGATLGSAFIPVFALTGQEGKLFHPLAFTKTFAVLAATVLAVNPPPINQTQYVANLSLEIPAAAAPEVAGYAAADQIAITLTSGHAT